MEQVNIIGRMEDGLEDVRAECDKVAAVSIYYDGGAAGVVQGERFHSQDSEDRGGVVLRLTLDNFADSFLPLAKNIENGIEIHMAGDSEAQAFLDALRALLAVSAAPAASWD